MSVRITKENLDDIIKVNKEIHDEICECINKINTIYNKNNIHSLEKLAINILRKHNLIEIPIDDKYLGGKVEIRNNKKIPIINTAQPRVYQYFVAWHEIYHVLFDENLNSEKISAEINVVDVPLIERKADYFSASMILGNVFDYYMDLDGNFIDKIIKCMDTYKAPYKAILIKLYEYADKYQDEILKRLCLEYIDKKPNNFIEKFEELGLDSEIIRPSNLIRFGDIESLIQKEIEINPDASYHIENKNYLQKLKNSISNNNY